MIMSSISTDVYVNLSFFLHELAGSKNEKILRFNDITEDNADIKPLQYSFVCPSCFFQLKMLFVRLTQNL